MTLSQKKSQVLPFCVLPKTKEKDVFDAFPYEKFSKNTVLLEQELTRVEKFYTLSSGTGHYYF